MAIPSFFKQNKPRGFNYVPRYFDPAREEREERLRAISMEHGAEGRTLRNDPAGHFSEEPDCREEKAQSMEQGAQGKEPEARSKEHGAWSKEQGPSADTTNAGSTPYRSKIMRGDMKNYFPRNKERVERHSMIRLLVIIMIMVLAIYIYFRFF